jgi:hypothetical protein
MASLDPDLQGDAAGTAAVPAHLDGGVDGREVSTDRVTERVVVADHEGCHLPAGGEQPVEELAGDATIVAEARRVLVEGTRRIAADVRNTLDFHHGQGMDMPVGHVVLTGPAVSVPGFSAALGAQLGMDVEDGVLDGTPPELEPGRVTIAAGLAVTEAPS